MNNISRYKTERIKMKAMLIFLFALPTFLFAGGSMFSSEDSSYDVPKYSVMISISGENDVAYLKKHDILVEWAHGDRAMVYVDAQGESMLRYMGYNPVPVREPEPVVAYPTLSEIYESIDSVVAEHPDICKKLTIGTSVKDRDIKCVVVSDNVNTEEIEPEMRVQGAIHGDEWTAATTTLVFLKTLTDNYSSDSACKYLVDNAEIWVIPVLNPDGYVADQRTNANDVDLNRNCSYEGPGQGGGSTAFSEPETKALRDLTMQDWPDIKNFINPFVAGLSLHGGEKCINTVWNYTKSPLPQDSGLIHTQALDYAADSKIDSYFNGKFWVAYPGASWYETHGDVNDWSYGECGTVDHTIEVHDTKHASDWPGVAEAHFAAMLEILTASTYGIWGTVKNGSGDPLDAMIEIGIHNNSDADSEPLRFCRTDVTLGDYHKALLAGHYDVKVSADGYVSKIVENVEVGTEKSVEVSFVLDQTGTAQPDPGEWFGELSIHPNPTAGFCSFTFPETGFAGTLMIYDITGRSVLIRQTDPGTAGFDWNVSDASGTPLPPGIYTVVFKSSGTEWTTRLAVTR